MTLKKVLTEHWGIADSHKLAVAEKHGAYEALKKVLRDKIPPAQVIAEVKASGLRGRGGAGFPTGQKWSFVPQNTGKPIYLCVNADESEPGTYKDREIMERDPHQLIEGSILASYAINAKTAFLYIRGEFDLPLRRMQEAVAEAEKAGYLGKNILGSGFDIDFLIHRGAGAYICGEETALLTSLEGNRGEPKIKPPFPAVKGAFGCPTIVNNVESIAAVPWIMRNGAAAYSAMGTEKSKGTKVISVSGRVKRPGNYEIELGYPAQEAARGRLRRHAGRLPAEGRDPGRLFGARRQGRRRRQGQPRLRVVPGARHAARLRGADRDRSTLRTWCTCSPCSRGSTRTSPAASARRAARARAGRTGSSSGSRRGRGRRATSRRCARSRPACRAPRSASSRTRSRCRSSRS